MTADLRIINRLSDQRRSHRDRTDTEPAVLVCTRHEYDDLTRTLTAFHLGKTAMESGADYLRGRMVIDVPNDSPPRP